MNDPMMEGGKRRSTGRKSTGKGKGKGRKSTGKGRKVARVTKTVMVAGAKRGPGRPKGSKKRGSSGKAKKH